jgi:hypothetical protein
MVTTVRSATVLPKSLRSKHTKRTYTKTDYGGGICVHRGKRSLGISGNRRNATVKGRTEVAMMIMVILIIIPLEYITETGLLY